MYMCTYFIVLSFSIIILWKYVGDIVLQNSMCGLYSQRMTIHGVCVIQLTCYADVSLFKIDSS